jgi:hypothetical protein
MQRKRKLPSATLFVISSRILLTIYDCLNKLYHGCGYVIGHLVGKPWIFVKEKNSALFLLYRTL